MGKIVKIQYIGIHSVKIESSESHYFSGIQSHPKKKKFRG